MGEETLRSPPEFRQHRDANSPFPHGHGESGETEKRTSESITVRNDSTARTSSNSGASAADRLIGHSTDLLRSRSHSERSASQINAGLIFTHRSLAHVSMPKQFAGLAIGPRFKDRAHAGRTSPSGPGCAKTSKNRPKCDFGSFVEISVLMKSIA